MTEVQRFLDTFGEKERRLKVGMYNGSSEKGGDSSELMHSRVLTADFFGGA